VSDGKHLERGNQKIEIDRIELRGGEGNKVGNRRRCDPLNTGRRRRRKRKCLCGWGEEV